MFVPGSEGLGVVLFYFIVFTVLLPFFIGFILAFAILKKILSDKKGRFYIKASNTRIFVTLLISFVVGGLFMLLLRETFGDMLNYLNKIWW